MKQVMGYVIRVLKGMVVLAALLSVPTALAQPNTLTPAERSVCDGISDCVDLLLRHRPDEFDYAVLADEFAAYGPKGRAALIRQMGKESKADQSAHALRLSLPDGAELSFENLKSLDRLWGGAVTQAIVDHDLISAMPAPLALDMIARTLNSSDPNIADQSRAALASLPQDAPKAVTPAHYRPILQSALRSRDPALARFVARIPAKNLNAPHAALLQSGELALVSASYRALFADNKAKAFKALLAAMRAVKTPRQARAIGDMLAARNAAREDGFYARFGAEISGDTEFPPLARAAGLQGYLISLVDAKTAAQMARLNSFDISPTPERGEAWMALLSEGEALDIYSGALAKLKNKAAQSAFVEPLWAAAQLSRDASRAEILRDSSAFAPTLRETILTDSLHADDDPDLIRAAIKRIPAQPNAVQTKRLDFIRKAYPVFDLRRAAGAKPAALRTAARQALSCQVPQADLTDLRDQMPYFDRGRLPDGQGRLRPALRGLLSTAHPTRSGWLAGYQAGPHQGGLIYFDNQSGAATPVAGFEDQDIFAILAAQKLKLGDVANEFIIVSVDGTLWRLGRDLRVNKWITGIGAPEAVDVSADGRLLLQFSNRSAQPPLVIYPDGSYALACAPDQGRVGGATPVASLKQPVR